MSKKQTIVAVVVGLMTILVAICLAVPVMRIYMSANIYIFADITECNKLEALHIQNGQFTKYQDTAQDDNLKNLSYSASFCGKYSSDQCRFEIFAYEFKDTASARTYFEKAVPKDSGNLEQNYSISSGMGGTELVAFSGNKAYAVSCPTRMLSDVLAILEETLTVKIK